jgi:hypothetical protein
MIGKEDNQGTVQNDFSGMNSDAMSPNLNTAGGIDNPSYRRKESTLIKNPIFSRKICTTRTRQNCN